MVELGRSLNGMHVRWRPFILLVRFSLLSALLFGCSERLPLASGALEGRLAPNPTSWAQVAQDDIIQLETSGVEGPYSVNLWTVAIDGDLHVFAGDNYANWVENIDADPRVRLQSEGEVFELIATRVTRAAHFERFALAWEAKYGNRPRNENVDETYLYQLTPRGP